MAKLKITIEDAKAELRDAATGPHSQHWSYSPAIMALLNNHDELLAILGEATAALEEKDQQLDAEVRAWTQKYVNENARAKSAEQREEHLKATVDVLSAKNAELETGHSKAAKQVNSWRNLAKQSIAEREKDIAALDVARQRNAELEQRLQQPIKLPPLMPEDIFAMTPQRHMVANAHNNAITACSMSIRDAGFKSECTVWDAAKVEGE